MDTLSICLIVAAVIVGSGLFYFLTKKLGLSIVNIALSIVMAIKSALADSTLASGKISIVLDLIIQALTYVQAICDEGTTTDTKVVKALNYIQNIAAQLSVTISDTELLIIKNVLQIGFTIMGALGVSSKTSYKKLYARMAKYAGTSAEMKAIGLKVIGG